MNLSQMMHKAFPGGGARSLQCQCGRSHHAVGGFVAGDDDAAELEAWRANPHTVIHDGCDAVTCVMIAGQVLVDGCECGSVDKMASLLLAERDGVLALYRLELEQRQRQVGTDQAVLALAGVA